MPIPKTEELDEDRCFVICYTRGFKIKTLCICGRSSNFNYNETHLTVSYIKLINYVYNNLKAKFNKERDDWVKGLRNLTHDTINAFYPVQMERWLWKEFYRMTSEKENVNLKDVCAFLPQVNCQIPKIRLQEVFRNVNNRTVGELAFDEFASLCNTFTYDEKVESCCNFIMQINSFTPIPILYFIDIRFLLLQIFFRGKYDNFFKL